MQKYKNFYIVNDILKKDEKKSATSSLYCFCSLRRFLLGGFWEAMIVAVFCIFLPPEK